MLTGLTWCDTLTPTMADGHGGHRVGAGRKSLFGSPAIAKPFAMDFTREGRRALASIVRRTKLSRNAIVALLAERHADHVTFDVPRPFPDKARDVLSIRVPKGPAARLVAARRRTGHSYSDIGEALVRWFAAQTAFPPPPGTSRKRS